MIRKLLFLTLLTLALVGCLSVKEIRDLNKMNKFAPAAESYAKSIQWSDFETATFFIKDPKSEPDLDELENVKVTSYEVKRITHQREQLKILQTVELAYYLKDQLKAKTIRYLEVWEYENDDDAWYLISGFPVFE